MEYGCIGLSEEDAIAKYGSENIEVYHSNFQALEHTLPGRDNNSGYAKLVCLKTENVRNPCSVQHVWTTNLNWVANLCTFQLIHSFYFLQEKVLGFHYVGNNAGERK